MTLNHSGMCLRNIGLVTAKDMHVRADSGSRFVWRILNSAVNISVQQFINHFEGEILRL